MLSFGLDLFAVVLVILNHLFFTFYDKGLRIESNVNKNFVCPILVLFKGQQ